MVTSDSRALPLPGEARYLKAGIASGQQLRDPAIVERAAAMLLDIDRHGMDAVRRYSGELDASAPDRSRDSREDLDAAREADDPAGREHLGLGLERVRALAELQIG